MRCGRSCRTLWLWLGALAVCVGGRADADDLVAIRASKPPKLDGVLSEAVWQTAQPVGHFTLEKSEKEVPKKTSVRAAFDDRALYLGITCAEPQMSRVKAEERGRDSGAWEDDCIEIFLRPGNKPSGYSQLIFNTLGSVSDYRFGDETVGKPKDWNPSWQVKVCQHERSWQAEVRVGLDAWGAAVPIRGDWLGVKFGREDHTQFLANGDRTSLLYTWPPGTNYGHASGYGSLIFEGRNCLRNADFSRPGPKGFAHWSTTKGDERRFCVAAEDGVPTLRFNAPAGRNASIQQGLGLHPNTAYRYSAEVKNEGKGYLNLRVVTKVGEPTVPILARFGPSDTFKRYEVDFKSGVTSSGLFIFGSLRTGREAVLMMRNARVERVAQRCVPDYMAWEKVEPDPVHGLRSYTERHGVKPYEKLRELGLSGGERLVLRDTVTRTLIWKVTNDSVTEGHHYALWTPYSSNGAHLWFGSRRWIDGQARATHCVMESTGDGIRLLSPWYNNSGWWHPRDDDVYFNVQQYGRDTFKLLTTNVATMEQRMLADLKSIRFPTLAEPGPWSEWLLVVYPDGLTGELVKLDGSVKREVRFPVKIGETHFSRAHKDVFLSGRTVMRITPDGRLDPDFLIEDKGETRFRNMSRGGHGQSSPDETMYGSANGTVTLPDGSERQVIVPSYLTDYASFIGNNGYVSWRVTPEWMIYNNGPQAVKLWADGSNVQNICFLNTLSTTYYSMPWACSSPDGTKIAFRSTMTNQVDLYQAIVSLPSPPTNVSVEATQDGAMLMWRPPALHKEIKGYLVYSSKRSGGPFQLLTREPVAGTTFTDRSGGRARLRFYVLSSVEHSGIGSGYSAEVCAAAATEHPALVRHFYEAEQGKVEQPVVLRREAAGASNMHYVSASDYLASKLQKPGRTVLTLVAPKTAEYRLLGRARAKKGQGSASAELALNGRAVGPWEIEGGTWQWHEAGRFSFSRGEHRLEWRPASSAFELDRLCVTDDPAFVPRGTGLCDAVAPPRVSGLQVSHVSRYDVALLWTPIKCDDLRHYNVYCSRQPDFAPSQSTRIGSPYRTALLDWGLRPGTTYTYRVTAADRYGNEGQPSEAVAVTTGPLAAHRVTMEAEIAQVSGDVRSIEDAEASGGKAAWVPELGTTGKYPRLVPGKATGSIRFAADVPADGTYVVWARLRSTWREASLQLSVKGNRHRWPISFGYHHEKGYCIWGRGAKTSYVYCWYVARTNTCPDPRPFQFELKTGECRIELSNIREGLSVDQLVLTNDFSWVPDGLRNYY